MEFDTYACDYISSLAANVRLVYFTYLMSINKFLSGNIEHRMGYQTVFWIIILDCIILEKVFVKAHKLITPSIQRNSMITKSGIKLSRNKWYIKTLLINLFSLSEPPTLTSETLSKYIGPSIDIAMESYCYQISKSKPPLFLL